MSPVIGRISRALESATGGLRGRLPHRDRHCRTDQLCVHIQLITYLNGVKGSHWLGRVLHGDPIESLVQLAKVLPSGQTLYVEGTRSPLISAYLHDRPARWPLAIAAGTIWRRPDFHHMPMTEENVAGLAELMNEAAAPEVGEHIHAYRGTTAYLIWYDYPDSACFVRKGVPEAAIERLCRALDAELSSFD